MKIRWLLAGLILCGLLAMDTVGLAAGGKWAKKADMPTPRWGFATTVISGKIYTIGGSPNNNVALSTVEEYDQASNTWTMKADMPTARIFPAASTVDELIYVVGGSRSTNQPSYSLVEQYDPATDTWTAKTGMPTARFILATAVVNGRVYAIGGRNDGELPLSVVEEYTPAQDEWTARASMPVKRTGLAASEVAGKIYTMGGSQFIPPPHPGSGKTKEYTPPTFNQFNDQVQKMYVAYYGRPGDPGGIGFWGGRLQESGGDLSDIINEFGTSDEFTDRYGGLANEELVNNIYLQLFNRGADPEGLEFYVGWLLEGTRSLGDIALAIADGVQAGTDDFDIVANKLQVANTFSDKVTECDASYGAEEINGAKEIINSVDSTDTSVDVALGQIDALLC